MRENKTDVTIKEYLDARLEDADKAVKAALASNEKRLDLLNEWRGALIDVTATKITREEYIREHSNLLTRIEYLENFISNLQGRMWVTAAIIAAFSAAIPIIRIIFKI